MVVGNDVIDLELARAERKSENPRYLSKAFSEEEIEQVLNAEDPELRFWQFWAMKETAYKAHQRIFSLPRKMNPKAFHCTLEGSEMFGKVSIDESVYEIELDITSDYVHATTSSENISKNVFSNPENPATNYIESLSNKFQFKSGDFIIIKDILGIPSLVIKDHSMKIPFSLSHHGKFTAFAIPLINS